MSGEATARTNGRVARFRAWASGLLRPRGMRANRLAMTAGHAVALIAGILVLFVGVYMLVSLYYSVVPALATIVVAVVLIVIGLGETLFEAETKRRA